MTRRRTLSSLVHVLVDMITLNAWKDQSHHDLPFAFKSSKDRMMLSVILFAIPPFTYGTSHFDLLLMNSASDQSTYQVTLLIHPILSLHARLRFTELPSRFHDGIRCRRGVTIDVTPHGAHILVVVVLFHNIEETLKLCSHSWEVSREI